MSHPGGGPATARWGILGCGTISIAHGLALRRTPFAQLVAVADVDPAAAEARARDLEVRAFESIEHLLDEMRPDAVTIALPLELHDAATRMCAERGVHVLCEKPLAESSTHATHMIELCAARGVQLGSILNCRGYAHARWIKELVASGRFRPRVFTASLAMGGLPHPTRGGAPSLGSSMLLRAGIHYLDLLQWWLGELANAAAVAIPDCDRTTLTVAALAFASGAVGTFRTSAVGPSSRPARIELEGPEAHVVFEGTKVVYWSGPSIGGPPPAEEPIETLRFGPGHLTVIHEAAEAVAMRRPFPVDGAAGRAAVAACEEVYAAADRVSSLTPRGGRL